MFRITITTVSSLSTIFSCCKVVQLFMLLDMIVFILVSPTRFCYVGKNANSKEALRNQSCLTNKTHMAESLLATEYRPDVQSDQRTRSSSSIRNKSAIEYCYIFRHILRETLTNDYEWESVHSRFSCDFDDICKGKETNRIISNVVFGGVIGGLYCCSEDNCNSIDKMPKTPVANQICYNGESNASNVVFESCGHPDTNCITRTLIDKDRSVDMYSCDNDKLCDKLDRHGAYHFCHKHENGNITDELCCCVTSKCNKPSDPSVISEEGGSQADSASSTDSWRRVLHPIANPNSTDNEPSTTLVKGLVASILLVALIGIVVLLVLAYRRRKRREGSIRSDPNVIMQYEKLSGSDASLEGLVSV